MTGETLPRWHREPRNRVYRVNNLRIVLSKINEFMKTMGIRIAYDAETIASGNAQIQMGGVMWILVSKFVLAVAVRNMAIKGMNPKQIKECLLDWNQRVCAQYGIKIEDFTRSWTDGKALNALVHYYNPDMFDLDTIPDDPLLALEHAFAMGEQLGVPRLLDAEDVAVNPDERAIMTYVASMFVQCSEQARDLMGFCESEMRDIIRWAESQLPRVADGVSLPGSLGEAMKLKDAILELDRVQKVRCVSGRERVGHALERMEHINSISKGGKKTEGESEEEGEEGQEDENADDDIIPNLQNLLSRCNEVYAELDSSIGQFLHRLNDRIDRLQGPSASAKETASRRAKETERAQLVIESKRREEEERRLRLGRMFLGWFGQQREQHRVLFILDDVFLHVRSLDERIEYACVRLDEIDLLEVEYLTPGTGPTAEEKFMEIVGLSSSANAHHHTYEITTTGRSTSPPSEYHFRIEDGTNEFEVSVTELVRKADYQQQVRERLFAHLDQQHVFRAVCNGKEVRFGFGMRGMIGIVSLEGEGEGQQLLFDEVGALRERWYVDGWVCYSLEKKMRKEGPEQEVLLPPVELYFEGQNKKFLQNLGIVLPEVFEGRQAVRMKTARPAEGVLEREG